MFSYIENKQKLIPLMIYAEEATSQHINTILQKENNPLKIKAATILRQIKEELKKLRKIII